MRSGVTRVVVTGAGVVSPLGLTVPLYAAGLVEGRCAFAAPVVPRGEALATRVVAQVSEFDPVRHFSDRDLMRLDRVSQFAVVAAREAVAQSGLAFDGELGERTAAIIGTGAGGQHTQDDNYHRIYAEGARRLHPVTLPRAMFSAPASQVSMHVGIRGPTFAVSSACASSTHAVGIALQMLRSGAVDCAVAGGTEACLTFGALRAWEALRVMAPDTCRPFSIGRQGLVLGEGAAIVVLERLEDALRRGATILGEIAGFGMSADAKDLVAPDDRGAARALAAALADAGLSAGDVDYVNAHGTGTGVNDATETAAVKRAFGAHASRLAISSIKSMIGHALGAAGALQLVATLTAIKAGVAPPTMNYLGPDPDCDLDYVPNQARPMRIRAAILNSFGFGGLNAVLAVRRFDG